MSFSVADLTLVEKAVHDKDLLSLTHDSLSLRDLIYGKIKTVLKVLHKPPWTFARCTWKFHHLLVAVGNSLQLRCT